MRHVYTAESPVRRPREVVRAMIRGLLGSPYMAYRLCVKDVRAEYSRSAFGMVWDLLDPLILGLVFYFLAQVRVINPGELGMPYATFVIYGLLLYAAFADSITSSLEVMRRSKTLLTHLKLPPEALILSVFFRMLFNSSFRIAVMLIFSLATHSAAVSQGLSAFSPVGFIKFLFCYPLIIFLGMTIGVFLAPFNTIYGDVGKVVRIILVPLRYASPVLYAIPKAFPFDWIHAFNPVAPVLSSLRSLATANVVDDAGGLVIRCAVFAVIFPIAWLVFHLSIPVLAERA